MKKVISAIIILSVIGTGISAFRFQPAPGIVVGGAGIPAAKKALMSAIIGRWITQTTVLPRQGQASFKTLGSDVYQWSPDGNFILHTAYGIRDTTGFGAMEVIGYDSKTDQFLSYNFNPDGSFNIDPLIIQANKWIWTGKAVRSTGVFSKDGNKLVVQHDITTDGKRYEPFMEGVLTKGADQ